MEVLFWIMELGVMAPEISAAQRSPSSNSLSCGAFLEIKMAFSEVPMTTKVVDLFEYYNLESRNVQFGVRTMEISSSEYRAAKKEIVTDSNSNPIRVRFGLHLNQPPLAL
jgi:hypothetical protein